MPLTNATIGKPKNLKVVPVDSAGNVLSEAVTAASWSTDNGSITDNADFTATLTPSSVGTANVSVSFTDVDGSFTATAAVVVGDVTTGGEILDA